MKMRILKTILIVVAALVAPMAVQAQTAHTILVSWTTPAATSTWTGCTTADPCTYGLGRASISKGGVCPSATVASYPQLTTTSALSITDAAVTPGAEYCYVAWTIQDATDSALSSIAYATVPVATVAPQPPAGLTVTVK